MRLKYLELYGFKSFAEKTRLDFDSDFVGIVGPNGSGKSNISDAVRWALGEQSAKALRGSKMEDVIFAGNKDKSAMNMAEVTIVFDNSDGYIPLPYENLSVSRKVFRSGESEYRINKQRVRRMDVRDLFLDTGIGKEGYSIISQGRIDDILSSNSDDRRKIFEEAARISKYKNKKIDASRRLEKTGNELEAFSKDLGLKVKEEAILRKQAENAREGVRLTRAKDQVELSLVKKKLDQLGKKRQDQEAGIKEKKDLQADLVKQMAQVKEKLAPHQEAVLDFESKKTRLETQKQDLEKKIIQGEKDLTVLEEQDKFQKENLNRLKREEAEAEGQIASSKKLLKKAQENEKDLVQRVKAYKEEEAGLALPENDRLEGLKNHLDELTQKKEAVRSKLAYLDFQKQSYEEDRIQLEKNKEGWEQDLARGQADLDEKNQALVQEQKKLGEGAKQEEAIKLALEDLDRKVRDLSQAEEEGRRTQANLEGKLAGLRSRYQVLEAATESYEGYAYAVKHLLQAGSRNQDLASHMKGSLAGLIRVKPGYEKAINAVMGGAFQNIVTESQEDAKYLIQWLKAKRLGRVTFLPIESIRGRRPVFTNQAEELANGVEVVDYPEDLKGIIYHFLGRTSIVKDLDQAISLSRKDHRNRIVSLDGDVINSWGSMVGGKTKQRRGGDLINRRSELASLAKEIKRKQASLKEVKTRLNSYQEEKEGLAQTRQVKQEEDRKIKSQMAACREKEADLKTQLSLGEQKLGQVKDQLGEDHSFDEEGYQEKKSRLGQELEGLDQELKDLKSKLEKEESAFREEEKNQAILAKQVEYTTRELNIARNRLAELEESLAGDQGKLEASRREAGEIQDQLEAKQKKAGRVHDQLLTWKKTLKETEAGLEDLASSNQDLQKALKGLLDQRDQVEEEADQVDRALYEAQVNLETTKEKEQASIEDYCGRYDLSLEAFQARMEDLDPVEASRQDLREIQQALSKIGYFRFEAIEEHKELKEELEFLKAQVEDLTQSKEDIESLIHDLDQTMEVMFSQAFHQISESFNQIFQTLFNGGTASLELDSDDPLAAGIEIKAQPPGKKLQSLDLLSGGERSMTALALLFAIFSIHPTPFCILDEIDASLDEANIGRYVRFLQTLKDSTQFIVITHRKTTMELCDMLYGLTMDQGISKIYSLRFEDYEFEEDGSGLEDGSFVGKD